MSLFYAFALIIRVNFKLGLQNLKYLCFTWLYIVILFLVIPLQYCLPAMVLKGEISRNAMGESYSEWSGFFGMRTPTEILLAMCIFRGDNERSEYD